MEDDMKADASAAPKSTSHVPLSQTQADSKVGEHPHMVPSRNDGHHGEPPALAQETQPSADPRTKGDIRALEDTGLERFRERIGAMESKVGLIDIMYGLHESTTKALEHQNKLPTNPEHSYSESHHLTFFSDVLFFMKRVRESHEIIVRSHENRRHAMELAKKRRAQHSAELDSITQVSAKAFIEGERAKMLQVDWSVFIYKSCSIEESVLAPIEVVSEEPETRKIIQLATLYHRKKMKYDPKLHQIERTVPKDEEGKFSVQQPLPERIKLISVPLAALYVKVTSTNDSVVHPPLQAAEDGSMVMLRPYQSLVYFQAQLHSHLSSLEEKFKNWDGADGVSDQPVQTDTSTAAFAAAAMPLIEETQGSIPDPSVALENHPRAEQQNPGSEQSEEKPDLPADEGKNASAPDQEDEEEESDLKGLDKRTTSVTALLHLRCLMNFVDTEIRPKQEYISSSKCSRVYFHDLWFLFKPGDEVIDQMGKQAYVVLRVQIPRHRAEDPWERWNQRAPKHDGSDDEEDDENNGPFTLHCAYIDFDGKNFGPVSKKFQIQPYDELKPIRSLTVRPLRFAEGHNTRKQFIERGRKLLDVSKFKAMYYMGVTLDKRDEIDSQVVIDFHEALLDEERRNAWEPTVAAVTTAADNMGDPCEAPCCENSSVQEGLFVDTRRTEDYIKTLFPENSLRAPSLILSPKSLEDTLNAVDDITDTEFLIMTYRVFGFVLRSRKWAQLDLGSLHYENANVRSMTVNAFESLELPEGHREMVKSLVIQHFRSKQSILARDEQTDLIQGKGKGLILLLHGAPGVGKTTTAEGIAELFRKPLFQITCGDLGTTAKEVESELEKNFALASRWGCILLLDEADVFLMARDRMDFKRNGLVAVFLRVLEYYSGILILTTNRVGDFDEAFTSRIHMSLYYPELDEVKTLKVFKLNLDLIQKRFEKQGRSLIFDESSIEHFAQKHYREEQHHRWNGRQIRNACQTALALAEYDAQGGTLDINGEIDTKVTVKLQLKYFRTVQKAYLEFGRYMGDIQGTPRDNRAIDHRLRARENSNQQARRSLFSQRSESGPGNNWSHHRAPSDTPDFASDSFSSQGYPNTSPGINVQLSQGHYQYDPRPGPSRSYPAQSRPMPMSASGGYDNPSPYGRQDSQQGHGDPRHTPMQQGQFAPPPGGAQGILQRESSQRPSPSFDATPSAEYSPRHHQMQQGPDYSRQGGVGESTGEASGYSQTPRRGQERPGIRGVGPPEGEYTGGY